MSEGRVGLVGLGLVGTALSKRLVQAGFEVVGFDRRPEAGTAWLEHTISDGAGSAGTDAGAGTATAALCSLASSPAEVGVACSAVVLAVFDTAGVLEATEGLGGLLEGGKVQALIDCSTGDPQALQALSERLAARGVDFIEAPLSGSSTQIAAGEATMLLGASADALQRHAALLQALSPRRIHVGGAGMGARAKLATNLVLGLNRAVLAEGIAFAETLGIPAATFLELVLATPARSEAAVQKGRRMVDEDFAPPQSRIVQHLKDVELMLGAAAAAGRTLPLSETHAALLRAAVAAGDGELDNAAILRQFRRETS